MSAKSEGNDSKASQQYTPPNENKGNSPGSKKEQPTLMERINNRMKSIMGIMQSNIEDAQERGESLEAMAQKTEDLRDATRVFASQADQVHHNLERERFRRSILLAITVILIITATVAIVVAFR